MSTETKPDLRILEFFSGIGGLRASLERSKVHTNTTFCAIDINEIANTIYEGNYKEKVVVKNLDTVSVEWIEEKRANVWFMSPPCQPYNNSIMSKHKDIDDPRAKSVLHLYRDVLKNMENKPEHIFIENVPLFKESLVFKDIMCVLNELEYHIQDIVISPHQIGIPNSRTRYYVMARKTKFETPCTFVKYENVSVSTFLENTVDVNFEVKKELLLKKGMLFDIVGVKSQRTCCFTKSYTKIVEGTGSILAPQVDTFESVKKAEDLLNLHLRYFTPTEIKRIHGFPETFTTNVAGVSEKGQYQCLGNSVSCYVISQLMEHLFSDMK
ncbi:methyltransferase, putative [Entamoeba invadens IP1]|uniref:Methyltransferase, putative n=2 Tax=Entamoeba invadens TaxID=33085 RepID=A0A0A1TXC1_ENTIV|nr:methyltransferase, putative [Entamoeba invadens IP1]AAT84068.1 5-cytosine DNA methyltransferase [Entamoeba invadens]ELP85927.1 methyltransferase, putative [Entamoeba invadens IP1]|eukprot:XP_004185273.1 methyltransferase, putative [Entamoeba invadens IP1]